VASFFAACLNNGFGVSCAKDMRFRCGCQLAAVVLPGY
jgi:hypothetical protein